MKKFKWLFVLPLVAAALSFAFADEPAQASGMQLGAEIQIGTGIEKFDPTGVAESFPANVGQLVGWTRISGADAPIVIKHSWVFNGEEKTVIELPVKSATFRTWSRKNIYGLTGKWRLDVKGPDGSVVASKEFEVVAENAAPVNEAPPAQAPEGETQE